jgi:hypothetical protein
MGRELRLPDQVMLGQVGEEATSRESYAVELSERLLMAYDSLREKQARLRAVDTQEPPLFSVGDQVWLQSKRTARHKATKLQPKFTGPYAIQEVCRNHTYLLCQNGRSSKESEHRLKPYLSTHHPVGRAPVLGEPARQPTRQGMRSGQPRLEPAEATATEEMVPVAVAPKPVENPTNTVRNTQEKPASGELPTPLPTIAEEGKLSDQETAEVGQSETATGLPDVEVPDRLIIEPEYAPEGGQ